MSEEELECEWQRSYAIEVEREIEDYRESIVWSMLDVVNKLTGKYFMYNEDEQIIEDWAEYNKLIMAGIRC